MPLLSCYNFAILDLRAIEPNGSYTFQDCLLNESYVKKTRNIIEKTSHQWFRNIMKKADLYSRETMNKIFKVFCFSKKKVWLFLPTHPGCFCIITANAAICSKMMKSIIEVWFATNTCSNSEGLLNWKGWPADKYNIWRCYVTSNMGNTWWGRMLGRGPWYLTTPVHEATNTLHIISTNFLWRSNDINMIQKIHSLYWLQKIDGWKETNQLRWMNYFNASINNLLSASKSLWTRLLVN